LSGLIAAIRLKNGRLNTCHNWKNPKIANIKEDYNKSDVCNKSKIGEISSISCFFSRGIGFENFIGKVIVSMSWSVWDILIEWNWTFALIMKC
jgi:hypothetical protein